MLEVLFGILDIRHSKKRAHRILIVGDDALSCSTIAEHLSSIYDFKTTIVELESNSLDEQSDKISQHSVVSDDIYIAKVPLECIFAEIRRRNWYKGCVLDFFSPPGNEYNIDNVNNITIIPNAHVIVYITNYSKYSTGFKSASEFFLLNKHSMACKILIIDTSNICDDIAVDVEHELAKFIEAYDNILIYKSNLSDEQRIDILSGLILDEIVYYLGIIDPN